MLLDTEELEQIVANDIQNVALSYDHFVAKHTLAFLDQRSPHYFGNILTADNRVSLSKNLNISLNL